MVLSCLLSGWKEVEGHCGKRQYANAFILWPSQIPASWMFCAFFLAAEVNIMDKYVQHVHHLIKEAASRSQNS